MKFRIRLQSQLQFDLVEAYDGCERRSNGLGERLREDFEMALGRIGADPFAYPCAGNGYRKIRLKRFPYSIFCTVMGNEIQVCAFLHARREPKEWRKRFP